MSDPSDSIPYGRMMHDAVCGVIRQVLQQVSDHGLPGDHHFFITFDTRHDQAELADWLRDRYPEEMMIVIQHWYDGLDVDEAGFSVTLNFGDAPERLRVPFDAILTFVDPSVEFGWRFERTEEEDGDGPEDGPPAPEPPEPTDDEAPAPSAAQDADVVSLDTFRRNH
ncbi:ClpXP protease specificity-enhancing factor SspB [Gymnodinialimonas sp. 2305UL16-5]|uniref:SspB family protein n=1 Tax=Gymnodinialimonas mytili TaxID=3126503 RepID=UPI0030A64A77